jgi:hypothetical protein
MSVVMEMDSYVSNLGWGVVMVLVQKRNRTRQWLKSHASVSQFFCTKRTHSRIPGLKGEALFSKLLSSVSADRRLVRIRILICITSSHMLIYYVNSFLYDFVCINL